MTEKERIANRLRAAIGADIPTAMQVINRTDYSSDDEYLDALARYEVEQQHNDKLIEARRKYARLLNEQREQEEFQKREEAFKEIHRDTKLTPEEAAQVEAQATISTADAVRQGKLSIEDVPQATARIKERLEKEAINRKAGNTFLNEMFRQEFRESRNLSEDALKRMSEETIEALTGR